MLNSLLRQIWLTIVYPFDPTFGRHIQFNPEALEPEVDSVKRGLYKQLKERYFGFVSHFKDLEQEGRLTDFEADFWRGWMQSLCKHVDQIREGIIIPDNGTSLATLRTLHGVQLLVSHQSNC